MANGLTIGSPLSPVNAAGVCRVSMALPQNSLPLSVRIVLGQATPKSDPIGQASDGEAGDRGEAGISVHFSKSMLWKVDS